MFISQEKETESQSHVVPTACGVLASGVHVAGKCFFKNVRRVGNKLKHTHTNKSEPRAYLYLTKTVFWVPFCVHPRGLCFVTSTNMNPVFIILFGSKIPQNFLLYLDLIFFHRLWRTQIPNYQLWLWFGSMNSLWCGTMAKGLWCYVVNAKCCECYFFSSVSVSGLSRRVLLCVFLKCSAI